MGDLQKQLIDKADEGKTAATELLKTYRAKEDKYADSTFASDWRTN